MRIESIAVIGATELGCQFAALSLNAGCRTLLEDISISALERGAAVVQALRASDARGSSAKAPAAAPHGDSALVLAHAVEDAVREADLILETVADELEVKLELFSIFDKFAKPGAILATTTTNLSLADLAAMTFCPERCIGLRIPARHRDARTLQVVRGTAASDEVVAACCELAQRMGLSVELLAR